MRRLKKIIKNNIKVLIAFILGGIIIGTCGVYAATVINASDVSYSNASSGMTSENVQGAIEELNTKIEADKIKAYKFNYPNCITGEETTCVETSCYKSGENCTMISTSSGSPRGTIIKYKVNNKKTKTFYVLNDDGKKITMITRNLIGISSYWSTNGNPGDKSFDMTGIVPDAVLTELNKVTSDWTNVNMQTYTLGVTNFNNGNAFTQCESVDSCTSNSYTYSVSGRARLITVQEINTISAPSLYFNFSIYPQNPYIATSNTNGSYVWGLSSKGSLTTYPSKNSAAPSGLLAVVEITKP